MKDMATRRLSSITTDDYGTVIEVGVWEDGDGVRGICLCLSGEEASGDLSFGPSQIAELKAALGSIDTPSAPMTLTPLEQTIYASVFASCMMRARSVAAMTIHGEDDAESWWDGRRADAIRVAEWTVEQHRLAMAEKEAGECDI